jgi:hypothetical protein
VFEGRRKDAKEMTLRGTLVISICILGTPAYANWTGAWFTKGSDAIIGLSSDPSIQETAKNGFLVIGYSKKFGCRPVVSVIVMKGLSMGEPVKQQTSKSKKNQLVVTVARREYSSETKMTEYTTAIELAMYAPDALITALSNPASSLSARIGTTNLLSFQKASNFVNANQLAKANCR